MIIKNIDVQLIKISKREGITKDGKNYLFYVAQMMDDKGELLSLKLGNEMVSNEKQLNLLLQTINKKAQVDLALYTSGFLLKGNCIRIDIVK